MLLLLVSTDLRANLSEWEQKEEVAKKRNEQLHERLLQLDTTKRDVTVQLDRFRLNEQYPFHRAECILCFVAASCVALSRTSLRSQWLSLTCLVDYLIPFDDFTTSKESLDVLMNRYEEAKQELLQYYADHQNDIPVAKYVAAKRREADGGR